MLLREIKFPEKSQGSKFIELLSQTLRESITQC